MDARIDRRVARTRRLLQEALIHVMREKGYDAVTVQDIVDQADVGRSTFYSQFAGKDDLFRRGFETLRHDLASAESASSAMGGRTTRPLAFSTAFFEHVDRHADLYRLLLSSRGGTIAQNEVQAAIVHLIRMELEPVTTPEGRELVVRHIAGAFMGTLAAWLEHTPRRQAAEVDALFRQLVVFGLSSLQGQAYDTAARIWLPVAR